MTERRFPDPVCGAICKFAMSEHCIEKCVPNGDMELLEPKKGLTLDRMPAYRKREDISWKARVRLHEVYTEKIIDHLQGKGDIYETVDFVQGGKEESNGYTKVFPERSLSNRFGHSKYSESVPVESVPTGPSDETPEDREEHPGT